VGKRNSLACYGKARQHACSAKNIKSGWRETGLWPVSVAKALMSPLLLKTNNNASSAVNSIPDTTVGSRAIENWESAGSTVAWSTPRKAKDLQGQLRLYSQLDQPTSTQRLLFRKVQKAFDEKDYALAISQRENLSLKAQLEAARPRKKKRRSRSALILSSPTSTLSIGPRLR
jgi:hypothetical protein